MMKVDVGNAFNSGNWRSIQKSLMMIDTPSYPATIIDIYLVERSPWYDTYDIPKVNVISVSIPWGFLPGPLLRNIMNNNVLPVPWTRKAGSENLKYD